MLFSLIAAGKTKCCIFATFPNMVISYDIPQISLKFDCVSPFDLKKPFVHFFKNICMRGRYGVKNIAPSFETQLCFNARENSKNNPPLS